ncbi:leucine-rich repeat protein soc-2 homolog isoform X2 [Anopheles merus]|uniref:leucine-rich repeat protein soc-2 homolog isoform X2 n=1 Tax=Anopheles merus TaxID=30066 RepID=UPI001BE4C5F7|nr:leucine-rich repeat protein soc-2 homolog isoform X2 [Anopheles merus]
MFRWIVWSLIVANTASSPAKLGMYCFHECYIYNFQSKGDIFAFQHISTNFHVLNLQNVLMKRVRQWILERLPPSVDTLKIGNSNKLKWISVPQALRYLHVRYSGLRRIDIAANSSLSILHIFSSDKLMKVPPAIKNAPKLEYLRLRECGLRMIDLATFCNHAYLSELRLDSNKIRYIVNTAKSNCSFYNSFTRLVMSRNMLTTVNVELFNVFANLRTLNLKMNRITSLSGRLVARYLDQFGVDRNKLEQVDLCGWDVPSMETVVFASNDLTTLPECLNNWTSVSQLLLQHNKLTNFSIESVAGWNNLTSLTLSCNKLTDIVLSSVHFPKNLASLEINQNYLTTLDLSFVPVRSLRVSVNFNLISSFDVNNISPNVTRLSMMGNPVDCSRETELEQLYGECIRHDAFTLEHNQQAKICNAPKTTDYYI